MAERIAAGQTWERRGQATDLRIVIDRKFWWQVRFTYTVSGLRGITSTRKLRRQYQLVG